jgi:hypothetical protein
MFFRHAKARLFMFFRHAKARLDFQRAAQGNKADDMATAVTEFLLSD